MDTGACAIVVEGLHKTYRYFRKPPGLGGTMASLFRRRYLANTALKGISFSVGGGELLGLIGPNGAGKTTTLKVLAGLLHPDAGTVSVLGHQPWRRRPEFLRQIGFVMGNRGQLIWDLPAIDTLSFNAEVYGVDRRRFRQVVDELAALLGVESLLDVQVRKLSLGERMKLEVIACLVHEPRLTFLDEPTLGLDLISQRRLREFVREYNQRTGTTVVLSSHYLEDIRQLARRVLIINAGAVVYDGPLEAIVSRAAFQYVTVRHEAGELPPGALAGYGRVERREPHVTILRVDRDRARIVAAALINVPGVVEVALAEPSLEDVIADMYTPGAAPDAGAPEAGVPAP